MKLVKTQNEFVHQVFGNLTTITNENNEVFFLAGEIAIILEQETKNILRRLDDDEIISLTYEDSKAHFPSLGIHASGLRLLTESGLYSAILGSNKPEAKDFKKWVTSEVLPSIRKTGQYSVNKLTRLELLEMAIDSEKRAIEAESKNAILMHVNKTYTSTELAKELGMLSAIQLNTELSKLKIQYKQNGTYVLYSQHSGHGYDQIKQEVLDSGKVVYHRRWTQLGRNFILNLLKTL